MHERRKFILCSGEEGKTPERKKHLRVFSSAAPGDTARDEQKLAAAAAAALRSARLCPGGGAARVERARAPFTFCLTFHCNPHT